MFHSFMDVNTTQEEGKFTDNCNIKMLWANGLIINNAEKLQSLVNIMNKSEC